MVTSDGFTRSARNMWFDHDRMPHLSKKKKLLGDLDKKTTGSLLSPQNKHGFGIPKWLVLSRIHGRVVCFDPWPRLGGQAGS